MNIDHETLKQVLQEILNGQSYRCHLEDAGITPEEHKEHHKAIKQLISDLTNVRKAFIMGVITTMTGGILGFIWLYLKSKWRFLP